MNPSPTPAQSPSVLRTIAAGWRRVLTALRPDRLGGRITYGDIPSAPADCGLVIGVIDDPDLAMRLLSVRGRVSSASLGALREALAEVGNHALLHLDLTDAEFADAVALSRVGALLDDLEDRRVRIRIVGLGRLSTPHLD